MADVENVTEVAGVEDVAEVAGVEDVAEVAGVEDVAEVAGVENVTEMAGVENVTEMAGVEDVAEVAGVEDVAEVAGVEDVAEVAGVEDASEMADVENVIVIGSGPAGYTAALYTSRANLTPLVIEGFAWGGLLQQTTDVENYPGFPDGIMGPELMGKLREQAERFGARLETEQADRVELASEPGGVHRVWVGEREHRARTVILAMGAEHKKLGIPGEEELGGRGVSYCATCDAAFFRDAQTIIVGGGDSAMEEAIFLSKFARKVTIVHRRAEFRASKIMLERARAQENIELLTPYTIASFQAGENGALGHAVLAHAETGEQRELPATGVFIAVGHEPQSQLVAGQVDLDANGYVVTDGRSTRTKLPGVFAAGDLVDHTYRQAITAAGSGCQAALDAEWYLRDTPGIPAPAGMAMGDPVEAQYAPMNASPSR